MGTRKSARRANPSARFDESVPGLRATQHKDDETSTEDHANAALLPLPAPQLAPTVETRPATSDMTQEESAAPASLPAAAPAAATCSDQLGIVDKLEALDKRSQEAAQAKRMGMYDATMIRVLSHASSCPRQSYRAVYR